MNFFRRRKHEQLAQQHLSSSKSGGLASRYLASMDSPSNNASLQQPNQSMIFWVTSPKSAKTTRTDPLDASIMSTPASTPPNQTAHFNGYATPEQVQNHERQQNDHRFNYEGAVNFAHSFDHDNFTSERSAQEGDEHVYPLIPSPPHNDRLTAEEFAHRNQSTYNIIYTSNNNTRTVSEEVNHFHRRRIPSDSQSAASTQLATNRAIDITTQRIEKMKRDLQIEQEHLQKLEQRGQRELELAEKQRQFDFGREHPDLFKSMKNASLLSFSSDEDSNKISAASDFLHEDSGEPSLPLSGQLGYHVIARSQKPAKFATRSWRSRSVSSSVGVEINNNPNDYYSDEMSDHLQLIRKPLSPTMAPLSGDFQTKTYRIQQPMELSPTSMHTDPIFCPSPASRMSQSHATPLTHGSSLQSSEAAAALPSRANENPEYTLPNLIATEDEEHPSSRGAYVRVERSRRARQQHVASSFGLIQDQQRSAPLTLDPRLQLEQAPMALNQSSVPTSINMGEGRENEGKLLAGETRKFGIAAPKFEAPASLTCANDFEPAKCERQDVSYATNDPVVSDQLLVAAPCSLRSTPVQLNELVAFTVDETTCGKTNRGFIRGRVRELESFLTRDDESRRVDSKTDNASVDVQSIRSAYESLPAGVAKDNDDDSTSVKSLRKRFQVLLNDNKDTDFRKMRAVFEANLTRQRRRPNKGAFFEYSAKPSPHTRLTSSQNESTEMVDSKLGEIMQPSEQNLKQTTTDRDIRVINTFSVAQRIKEFNAHPKPIAKDIKQQALQRLSKPERRKDAFEGQRMNLHSPSVISSANLTKPMIDLASNPHYRQMQWSPQLKLMNQSLPSDLSQYSWKHQISQLQQGHEVDGFLRHPTDKMQGQPSTSSIIRIATKPSPLQSRTESSSHAHLQHTSLEPSWQNVERLMPVFGKKEKENLPRLPPKILRGEAAQINEINLYPHITIANDDKQYRPADVFRPTPLKHVAQPVTVQQIAASALDVPLERFANTSEINTPSSYFSCEAKAQTAPTMIKSDQHSPGSKPDLRAGRQELIQCHAQSMSSVDGHCKPLVEAPRTTHFALRPPRNDGPSRQIDTAFIEKRDRFTVKQRLVSRGTYRRTSSQHHPGIYDEDSDCSFSDGVTLDLSMAEVSNLTNPTTLISKAEDYTSSERSDDSGTHDSVEETSELYEATLIPTFEAAATLMKSVGSCRMSDDAISASNILKERSGDVATIDRVPEVKPNELLKPLDIRDDQGWDLSKVETLFPHTKSSNTDNIFHFESDWKPFGLPEIPRLEHDWSRTQSDISTPKRSNKTGSRQISADPPSPTPVLFEEHLGRAPLRGRIRPRSISDWTQRSYHVATGESLSQNRPSSHAATMHPRSQSRAQRTNHFLPASISTDPSTSLSGFPISRQLREQANLNYTKSSGSESAAARAFTFVHQVQKRRKEQQTVETLNRNSRRRITPQEVADKRGIAREGICNISKRYVPDHEHLSHRSQSLQQARKRRVSLESPTRVHNLDRPTHDDESSGSTRSSTQFGGSLFMASLEVD
jgi:hypothetical protein